jgi:hypothetical protein
MRWFAHREALNDQGDDNMKMKIVRALLWMIRTFNFCLVLDDNCVSIYRWRRSHATGFHDWFESPNAVGLLDREYVETTLEVDGFGWLVWQILTRSELQTRRWQHVDSSDEALEDLERLLGDEFAAAWLARRHQHQDREKH